jgi:GTP cyclohydrolase II
MEKLSQAKMLLDQKSKIILSVERAANDLRKGFPVVISQAAENLLVLSPETAAPEMVESVIKQGEDFALIITANRLNFIDKVSNAKVSCSLRVSQRNIEDIPALCGVVAQSPVQIPQYKAANDLQNIGLQLARIAELLPSVLTIALPKTFVDENILSTPATYIKEYNDVAAYELQEACRTNLALKHNITSEIIAYRPNLGGKEHYAIIIGKPEKTPLVRVHSSCYTGDLLESLACDCHDQLHTAIDLMHKNGGGIILYMLQEGRGIGLINKLRAYALKEQGFDTVDANEALGFDDDERLFLPAAIILKKLGIKEVKLLTNNPKKSSALEDCGIKVIECVPHIMPTNKHNEQYLKTKSDRFGHRMNQESGV